MTEERALNTSLENHPDHDKHDPQPIVTTEATPPEKHNAPKMNNKTLFLYTKDMTTTALAKTLKKCMPPLTTPKSDNPPSRTGD